MSAQTLPAVARRFGDFYVPRFEIAAGGTAIPSSVVRDVIQVAYNDSTTEIDSFDITVNNWDATTRTFKYVGGETSTRPSNPLHTLFEPCARDFELKLGYGSQLVSLVTGTPQTLEPSFPAGGSPTLTVRALNVLSKLRTKQHRDHWLNKKISEVAEDIGRRNEPGGGKRFPIPIRLAPANDRQSEPKLDYVAQDNLYDIDFLLLEARKIGYVVYVDLEPQRSGPPREVLYFGPSNARQAGVPDITYELKWGTSLIDFSPKLSTASQAKSVEVRAWDRQANRAIRKKVTARSSDIHVNRDLLHLVDGGGSGVGKGCIAREEVTVSEPQFTAEQAQRRAVALMEEKLKHLVEATGTTIGLPDLRAGQRVKIVGLGARFSGTYFVTRTTHTVNDSGYLTKFTGRREQGEDAS
jgi:Bacteriophage probable baseplate hub protein